MIQTASLTSSTHRRFRWLATALVVCAVIVSTACTTAPVIDVNDEDLSSITDPKARRLILRGDIEGAADRYSSLAKRARDPLVSQEYSIIAGEILYDRGMLDAGAIKLAAIPLQLDTPELQQRFQVLQAKDALFNSDPEAALAALPEPETVVTPIHRARVYEVQAQSYRQLQLPDEELAARIALEEQLVNPDIVDKNHVQIWQLLTTQPLSTLREMTTNVRSDTYQGWIELALAQASSGTDSERLTKNLKSWQTRFPDHPAISRFAANLYSTGEGFQITNSEFNQIAVLLPLSADGIGAAADAIRDGIIVAYQSSQDRPNPPIVRFYDTGESASFVRQVYQNAVNDGADAIIGPLRKDAVAAIITQRGIPKPTLTLNYVDAFQNGAVENIIQFGLAPEDEAVAAATRAMALGYRHAIILQSDDSRGDRESRAFHEEMLLNGGDVVHTAILPVDEYDYSQQIRDSLLITQSDQRFKTLSNRIGQKLFFEPSIRDDVDVVFMAVNSEQARSVRPQLSFFRAANIPKFGTSRIVSNDDDPRANADLNTIFFSDAPWVLDPAMKKDPIYKQIVANFPDGSDVFPKLYALGIDAYFLMSNLNELTNAQTQRVKGYTGDLTLGTDGRIRRHLQWAHYNEGKIETVKSVELESPTIE